jgi:ribosome-binding ATPase YchF (GTP1/OBG family)
METHELRITALETKVDNIGDQLTAGFELILARLDSIDKRISDLKGNAKGNLVAVEVAVNDGFKKVIEELKKINHVTRYEDQLNNTPERPN